MLVLKVVRNVGSNLLSVYHVIPLSTEEISFSGLKQSILEISTDSHLGQSSVTVKTTVLFWPLIVQYCSLLNVFHACVRETFLYNGEKLEDMIIS